MSVAFDIVFSAVVLTLLSWLFLIVAIAINKMLGGKYGAGSSGVDIDALARVVIRGDYGNGDGHKCRLGLNYAVVQRRLNEMLA